MVSVTGTDTGGLQANLIIPETHTIIAREIVNTNGTNSFGLNKGIKANTSFEIILTNYFSKYNQNLYNNYMYNLLKICIIVD